jgi:hypothetical protein
MASTSSSSPRNKICRKCNGTCPPCRPWRCKYGKARTLEECENDLSKSLGPLTLKRSQSAPTNVHGSALKNESNNGIEKALAALNIGKNRSGSCGTSLPPGFSRAYANNDEATSSAASSNSTSTGTNRITYQYNQRQVMPLITQPKEPETSHIFLAIEADLALVEYSKMLLNEVIHMPEIPEINSLGDSRCIWPHTVHLTIHSFGKVLNVDIPRVVDYCKKNIEVIELFSLNITGMFHHQKLHTIGFEVEKRTVEPLRQIKSNMSKWFNKPMIWDGYTPVLSLLRTQSPRGAKFTCDPVSKQSIDIILSRFGGIEYVQQVIPARDIQLCLARSSTETTFYRNLLV